MAEHRPEQDFLHLQTDGSGAESIIVSALGRIGLPFTTEVIENWPKDVESPVLTARHEGLEGRFVGNRQISWYFLRELISK
ncbi:MAG: hypothetical protein M3Q14_00020 [bacterium]|nr:hypothetical protein [bacterium]